MAKAKVQYIAGSALTSLGAVVLGLVSLTTTQWVTSDANITLTTYDEPSLVSYGFFSGIYRQIYSASNQNDYPLTITCLFSSNICAMMCGSDSEETRRNDLQRLYNGEDISFACSSLMRSNSESVFSSTREADSSRRFINAGAYVSTIVFLILSILFGVIGTCLTIWNVFDNPIQVWFNIVGLYICNGIACGAAFVAIILWGALFGATLSTNVCFYYSITGLIDTENLASLGYSYWLMVPMVILYGCSIALLRLREYFINQDPQVMIYQSDKEDIANNIIF